MTFHDLAQSYTRPEVNIGIQRNVASRSVGEIPGGVLFWKAVGKVGLVVFVVTMAMNMLLGTYISHLVTVETAVEGQRHELTDKNINLRAIRAGMLSRQAVEDAAGKTLSLYVPEQGQRLVYNREKGRFDRM